MRRRGDVHTLPLEELAGADVKGGRPWLLVHDPPEESDFQVFAYGTSQATEEIAGAEPLHLRWRREGGGDATTRFFTVRLRTEPSADVAKRIGHARPYTEQIREAVRRSLGIGAGVEPSTRPSIQRGQVVVLSADVTRYLGGAGFAVIVTEPRYAALRRHQLLVPVYSGTDEIAQDGEIECDAPWVRLLPGAPNRVVIAVPLIFTHSEAGRPRQPGGIVGLAAARVDSTTMQRIDEALIDALQL